MKITLQPPELLSFVIADHIHRDASTGKYYLLGTYSMIHAPRFPYEHASLHVYIALTGGRGPTPIRLALVEEEGGSEPVFDREGVFEFPGPLSVVEFVWVEHQVAFERPGAYRLQVYGAWELLREQRIQVGLRAQAGATCRPA